MQPINLVMLLLIFATVSCSRKPAPNPEKFKMEEENRRTSRYTEQIEGLKNENQAINTQMQQLNQQNQQALQAKEQETAELRTKIDATEVQQQEIKKTLEQQSTKNTELEKQYRQQLEQSVADWTALKTKKTEERVKNQEILAATQVPPKRISEIDTTIIDINKNGAEPIDPEFITQLLVEPAQKTAFIDLGKASKNSRDEMLKQVKVKIDAFEKLRIIDAMKSTLKRQNRLPKELVDEATPKTLQLAVAEDPASGTPGNVTQANGTQPTNAEPALEVEQIEQTYIKARDIANTAVADYKRTREEYPKKLLGILEADKTYINETLQMHNHSEKRIAEIDAELVEIEKNLADKKKQLGN